MTHFSPPAFDSKHVGMQRVRAIMLRSQETVALAQLIISSVAFRAEED
jgi:hypothetical protein